MLIERLFQNAHCQNVPCLGGAIAELWILKLFEMLWPCGFLWNRHASEIRKGRKAGKTPLKNLIHCKSSLQKKMLWKDQHGMEVSMVKCQTVTFWSAQSVRSVNRVVTHQLADVWQRRTLQANQTPKIPLCSFVEHLSIWQNTTNQPLQLGIIVWSSCQKLPESYCQPEWLKCPNAS